MDISILGEEQELANKMHRLHKLVSTRLFVAKACRKTVAHRRWCREVTLGIYHKHTFRVKSVCILPNALIARYLGHNGPTYSVMR